MKCERKSRRQTGHFAQRRLLCGFKMSQHSIKTIVDTPTGFKTVQSLFLSQKAKALCAWFLTLFWQIMGGFEGRMDRARKRAYSSSLVKTKMVILPTSRSSSKHTALWIYASTIIPMTNTFLSLIMLPHTPLALPMLLLLEA
jgi:hypothetical protein